LGAANTKEQKMGIEYFARAKRWEQDLPSKFQRKYLVIARQDQNS
jgi:hypothetical protein